MSTRTCEVFSQTEMGTHLWAQSYLLALHIFSPGENILTLKSPLKGLITLKFLSVAFPSFQRFCSARICPLGICTWMPVLLSSPIYSEFNAPYFYQWYTYPSKLKSQFTKFNQVLLHNTSSMNPVPLFAFTSSSILDSLA